MNLSPLEHWFVAILVFELSIHTEKDGPKLVTHDPSIDLQYRLVRAADLESAYERAFVMGHEGAIAYENCYGQICAWTFMGLKDLQGVMSDELGDGVEVYGFITGGNARDHVASMRELMKFLGG